MLQAFLNHLLLSVLCETVKASTAAKIKLRAQDWIRLEALPLPIAYSFSYPQGHSIKMGWHSRIQRAVRKESSV